MSEELIEKEIQERIFTYLDNVIDYWISEKSRPSIRDKMEGLIFSVLVMVDGESMLPAFKLIPSPCPEDKDYLTQLGKKYYPDDLDVAGHLHEVWSRKHHQTAGEYIL